MLQEKRYYVTGKGTLLTGSGTEAEHHLNDCLCFISEIAMPGYCEPATMDNMVIALTTGKKSGEDWIYLGGPYDPPCPDNKEWATAMLNLLLEENYIAVE